MNMKLNILKVLLISTLGLIWSGYAAAGVVGSKHDLTTATGAAQATTAVTDEVCVFCHTPHGSAVNAPVPLWNKVLNTNQARFDRYSTLATPTFDSNEVDVGSVSLACLSCHDGTQAMDVIINRPGGSDLVDNYNPAGTDLDAAVGVMTGSPVPMLGEDLTNDHPISMQYAGGGALPTDTDGALSPGPFGDPDFNPPVKDSINLQPVWWVDGPVGGTALQRDKTDMILYTRADSGIQEPYVECGSCHDPHNDTTGVAANSVQFLRVDNAASQICTACHIK